MIRLLLHKAGKAIQEIVRNRVEESKTLEARVLRLPREEPEELELARDPSRLLAKYTVGPVEYYVYRASDGFPRMRIREPPQPSPHRLAEIVAGLDEPSDSAERYHVEKVLSGYDRLYPLVIDNNIEEIAVEGAGRNVLVVNRLFPALWIEVDMVLTHRELDSIVLNISRKIRRTLSLATPIAEGLTPEGYRVALTFKQEVSRAGSSLVIRKYPEKPVTIADLIASRTLSPLIAAYLWILLEAQGFIIIAGGMGAGKTTLLQALLTLVPPFNRIITIEDTPELNLPWHHWDALVARPGVMGESLPEIDLESLLKFALRRRAEYLVVGEVRGREARLLAQAAALGHGCVTTFHADSAESVVVRLQMEPINLPSLFLKSISSIVVLRKVAGLGWKAKRRVWEVAEIQGDEIVSVFTWIPSADVFKPRSEREVCELSKSLPAAWSRLSIAEDSVEAELAARAEYLERLVGSTPEEFVQAIKRFYVMRYGVL